MARGDGKVRRICEHCQRPFEVYPSQVKPGGARYCGKGCTNAGRIARRKAVLQEVFWSRATRQSSGCWEWPTTQTTGWYGRFVIDGVEHYAHRLAYEWTYGPVPEGMYVCHRCDNPPCINPDHLFLGTQTDNMRDMLAKGHAGVWVHPERLVRGDKHPSRLYPERRPRGDAHHARAFGMQPNARGRKVTAKVTLDQVRDIRRVYAEASATVAQLAIEYNLTKTQVRNILKNKCWKEVA